MSYFCDTASRESKEMLPGVHMRTFWQKEMLLSDVTLEPNAIVPMHNHPHEQSGTIISGTLEFTIDGEKRTITAGYSYIIPGGVDHMAVAGPEGAHVIDVFAPVREEYKY